MLKPHPMVVEGYLLLEKGGSANALVVPGGSDFRPARRHDADRVSVDILWCGRHERKEKVLRVRICRAVSVPHESLPDSANLQWCDRSTGSLEYHSKRRTRSAVFPYISRESFDPSAKAGNLHRV